MTLFSATTQYRGGVNCVARNVGRKRFHAGRFPCRKRYNRVPLEHLFSRLSNIKMGEMEQSCKPLTAHEEKILSRIMREIGRISALPVPKRKAKAQKFSPKTKEVDSQPRKSSGVALVDTEGIPYFKFVDWKSDKN